MSARPLTAAAELPAVRPLYFLATFARWGRVTAWVLWGLLALALGALLLAEAWPAALVLELLPVIDGTTRLVDVTTHTVEGIALATRAPSLSGYVTLVAAPLEVSLGLTLAWAALQAVGWGALLAASSRITSAWGYAIYVVVGWALVSGEGAQLIAASDPYRLVVGGLVLAVLVPAYACRQRLITLSLAGQVLLFTGLFAAYYGGAYLLGDAPGLHRVTTHALPALVAVVLFTILLTAREPLNFIFLLTTNGRTPERRQPMWVILALALSLLALGGLALANDVLDLGLSLYVRPLHLLALALLVAPVTGQNVYHQLRGMMPAQLAFVLLILSCGLLTVGTALYAYAAGEVLLMALVERLAALVYTVFGGLYLIYVLLHFIAYLQRRVNIYYVLLEPPHPTNVRYLVVWFLGLMLLLFLEGQGRWRTVQLASATLSNQRADNALLQGDLSSALDAYRRTVNDVSIVERPRGDWKANYQLAALGYSSERSLAAAAAYYRQAEVYRPFVPARLNHANLLVAHQRRAEAIVVLAAPGPGADDPRLLSNLAGLYLAAGQPDSAILTLKRAVAADPSVAYVYANLAQVYRAHGRDELAGPLLRVAATMAPRDPRVVVNAAAYALERRVPERWPRLDLEQARRADWPAAARLNLALLAVRAAEQATTVEERARRAAEADALANALVDDDRIEVGQALLIKLMTQLAADSLAQAHSRAEFLAERVSELRGLACHTMGVHYAAAGAYPKAADYFGRAARAGLSTDSVAEGQLRALSGDLVTAATQLDRYRAYHAEVWNEVAREVSLIERAVGQAEQALMTYPSARYTAAERLRQVRYATLHGDQAGAAEGLEAAAAADSTSAQPYLLAAEFVRAGNDSLPLLYLRAGRARLPQSVLLRLAQARVQTRLGQVAAARSLLDSLQAELPEPRTRAADSLEVLWQTAQAEWLLTTGQDSAGLGLLERLIARRPLDDRLQRLWVERMARRDVSEAMRGLYDAITLNDHSAQLWALAAQLNARVSRPREAREAAERALSLTWPEARREALRQALAAALEGDDADDDASSRRPAP